MIVQEKSISLSLFLILVIVLLSSCNGFSDKPIKELIVQSSDYGLDKFAGNFEARVFRIQDQEGNLSLFYGLREFENLFDIIEDEGKSKPQIPSEGNLRMNLTIIDEATIAIAIRNDFEDIFYQELKGKFRNDGFFYLNEKRKSFLGIPYLFGGLYKYQSRIAVSKYGSLLLQTAEINQGAFLFFYQKGYKRQRIYHFRRLIEQVRV